MFIKPKRLEKGDKIAVISPSFPALSLYSKRFKRAECALNSLGLEVIFAPNSKKNSDYLAGTILERASDLHWAFNNPEINGIMAAIGGLNSNSLLPHIDFNTIRKNAKIFIGYSDVTALLLSISSLTNMVTFHGPAFIPEFGEYSFPFRYTLSSFDKVLFNNKTIGKINATKEWTDEFLDWNKGEDIRKRKMKEGDDWRFLVNGEANGILFGGNVDTINMLCGTPYFKTLKQNTIFLIEVTHLSPAWLDRSIEHLLQCGIFEHTKGIIFGRYHAFDKCMGGESKETTEKKIIKIEQTLLSKLEFLNVPILSRVDLGHTDPMLTIPIGVNATISSDNNVFCINESAVE